MALELMPDGKTFKKLNATQYKALNNYYRRLHDVPLTQSLALPIGLAVAGTIGAIAYIFKDQLLKEFEEQKEDFFTWIFSLPKKAAISAGGGVADAIISVTNVIVPANPKNPEYVILNAGTPEERRVGPFSRCQRWEQDANDWLAVKQSKGDLGSVEETLAALSAAYIIKNMKKEGCPKPLSFTQSMWDDI